jgi:hypothetical protein
MLRGFIRCCLAAMALAVPGSATTIVLNQWYAGLWNPSNQVLVNESDLTGFPATVTDPGPNPWDFTAAFITHLIITDLGRDGDSFDVFDNSISIGSTSVPSNDFSTCGNDPDVCVVDPKFSHGDFVLAPGSHSITMSIKTHATDSVAGNNAFMVSTVPEPGSAALIAGGVALLLFRLRRRR